MITAAGDALNKAHIRYLEARLVETALGIGRVSLDNQTAPLRPRLTEAAEANMEGFLDRLLLVMPALRVDLFLSQTQRIRETADQGTAIDLAAFALKTPKYGIKAEAVAQDGRFIVRAGSLAQANWIAKAKRRSNYAQLHAQLVKAGVLVAEGKLARFAEDTVFSSPSAAAAVITGRCFGCTLSFHRCSTS